MCKAKELEEKRKLKAENPMRRLKIEKLCLNICVGESGDRLTRAAKVCLSIDEFDRTFAVKFAK